MKIDMYGQFSKWKALDRWENEGGSVSLGRADAPRQGSSEPGEREDKRLNAD